MQILQLICENGIVDIKWQLNVNILIDRGMNNDECEKFILKVYESKIVWMLYWLYYKSKSKIVWMYEIINRNDGIVDWIIEATWKREN